MRPFLISVAALAVIATPIAMAGKAKRDPALTTAVAASLRSDANRARDAYRNPAATLAFFGIKPGMTVVELWPGGGWYTEILAPYLAGKGQLIVAPPLPRTEGTQKFIAANPAAYGKVRVASFPMAEGGTPVAPGSADMVLTFRNVHNWRMGSGRADNADYSEAAFREVYAMLKPGGVLGIEDHRLNEDASAERERNSGYIKVSTVRRLAEQAGFTFAGASEINANPRDTRDYEKGVWTLPPVYRLGEVDRAKYAAIGESDRMTLKFVKPKN